MSLFQGVRSYELGVVSKPRRFPERGSGRLQPQRRDNLFLPYHLQ
jgi:hypothetical protein